jgi:hypothetical protein
MAKKASRSVGQRIRIPKTTETKKPINYSSRLAEFDRNASYDGSCPSCIDNVWHHSQITREED